MTVAVRYLVACDVIGCGDEYDTVGSLTARRITDHGSLPSVALIQSRRQFGIESMPYTPMVLTVPTEDHAIAVARPRSPVTPVLQRTARAPQRDVKNTSHQKKDPSACILCARTKILDGRPCKRHGGPTRGTSWLQRKAARKETAREQ